MGEQAADGSVVFPLSSSGAAPPEPVAQRDVALPSHTREASPSAVSVQTQESTTGPGPTAAGTQGADGAAGGEDIETLASRLYPRIARQLRNEITRERDRLGALADFRH